MPEMKKIATRVSYGEAITALGAVHDDIVVLDADLAAATQTGIFKKQFPERHIDCGIQEANMMGIAAGLAATTPVQRSVSSRIVSGNHWRPMGDMAQGSGACGLTKATPGR